MKQWIIIVSLGITIGAVPSLPAQVQHPTKHKQVQHPTKHKPERNLLTKNIAPLTPAEKSQFYKAASLGRSAALAMQSGNYAGAESYARQSLATGPDPGLAQEILAAALDAQGKTKEALQAYKVIVDAGDNYPPNLLPYALLQLKAGNWPEAVSAYNKALPLLSDGDLVQKSSNFSPDVPRPTDLATALHVALGLELQWRGYHGTYQATLQQSLVHFQQALTLEPNSSLANYYVGFGLKRVGREAEAQAAFRKAAALGGGEIKELAQKELPIAQDAR